VAAVAVVVVAAGLASTDPTAVVAVVVAGPALLQIALQGLQGLAILVVRQALRAAKERSTTPVAAAADFLVETVMPVTAARAASEVLAAAAEAERFKELRL
jgi:hypothetical protein